MPAPVKRSEVHETLNLKMALMIPELDSDYALTPLQFQFWKKPEDKMDNGDPCFIASAQDNGMKKNYIYAPKARGMKDEDVGYYHLLTQEAQIIAYRRLVKEGPSFWARCCRKKEHEDFFKVKRLLYNRTISKDPDDILAARARLLGAQTGTDAASRFGKAAYLPTLTTV